MKMSEAIFLGASLTKQAVNKFFVREHGVVVSTCAIGGALIAINALEEIGDFGDENNDFNVTPAIRKRWSWALDDFITPQLFHQPCPAHCLGFLRTPVEMIAHLNDNHEWSRERIADWVATIEPKDEPTPVELEKISTEFTGNPQEKERKELTPA